MTYAQMIEHLNYLYAAASTAQGAQLDDLLTQAGDVEDTFEGIVRMFVLIAQLLGHDASVEPMAA